MRELIDRELLLEMLEEEKPENWDDTPEEIAEVYGYLQAVALVSTAPTVTTREFIYDDCK